MIKLENVVPTNFLREMPYSSASNVLSKTRVKIYPRDRKEYQYGGYDRIVFEISSNECFADFSNSFVTAKVTLKRKDGAAFASTTKIEMENGTQSLLKRVVVYAADTNTKLADLNEVSLLAGLNSRLNYQLHSIDGNDRHARLNLEFPDVDQDNWVALTGTFFAITGGHLIGTATNFTSELRVGDIVALSGYVRYAISAINSNTDVTLRDVDANHTIAGQYYQAFVNSTVNNSTTGDRQANNIILSDSDIIYWSIPISLLKNYLTPLWTYRKGLRLEFELQKPEIALMIVDNNILTSGADLRFTDVSLDLLLVVPHKEIRDSYLSDLESGSLIYYSRGFIVSHISGSSGELNTTLKIAVGARSVRRVWCVIRDSTYVLNNDLAQFHNPTNGKFVQGRVVRYRFKIGSQYYPQNSVTEKTNRYYLNTFTDDLSMLNSRYFGIIKNVPANGVGTSIHRVPNGNDWIMGADLSRDSSMTGHLTGVDLTLSNIELEIERDIAYNANTSSGNNINEYYPGYPIYSFIVEVDEFLKKMGNKNQVLR